jgi:formate-dependent phosphoribosylglycinamide formyltransferase (GAR transformylase)
MNSEESRNNLKILFFEHNPYMSVELLDLLNDYKIICYNDDTTYRLLKKNWDVESYLNTEFIEEPESDKVAEILLSDQNFLNRTIQDRKSSKILFFYMNAKMDELRKKTGMSMLLPSFNLQERLGNKMYLSEICTKLGLVKNESLSFKEMPDNLADLFIRCREVLGLPFIVQDAMGESGWDTSLVSTEDELQEARKKIKGGLRATKYITNNIPVSVHVCILDDQTIIRGPWLQLMGFPELSLNPFRFAGNDTNQSLLSQSLTNRVLGMTSKIAEFAKAQGYRGILGIDYLWDKDTDVIYPQEINSRLVGGTRLLTGIQKDQSLFPDLLKHIEAFGIPEYSSKCKIFHTGEINFSRHNYSQIIVRNNEPSNIKILRRLDPGIYQLQEGSFHKVKQSLFVHDMGNDDVLITSAAHAGCELYSGEAIVRLILKKSVVNDGEYKLRPEAVQLINAVRKHATSML